MYGYQPLSKIGGSQIKDLPLNEKKTKIELYRPPGIIESITPEGISEVPSELSDNIWNSIPSSKIYIRQAPTV
jgi:hypothetical protein